MSKDFPLSQVTLFCKDKDITLFTYISHYRCALRAYISHWGSLEVDCHKLDEVMLTQGCESGPSYERYFLALHKQTKLKDEEQSLKNTLLVLQQLLTHMLLTLACLTLFSWSWCQKYRRQRGNCNKL